MKKIIYIFLALFFLVGCTTTKKSEVIYVPEVITNTVVISPPTELYVNLKRVKPPQIKLYSEASWDEKELMLFTHIKKLNIQIENLFNDRTALGIWVKENNKLIEERDKNKKENK